MKKKILLFFTILAVTAAVCGCSRKNADNEETTAQESTVQADTEAQTGQETADGGETRPSWWDDEPETETEPEPEPVLSGRVVIDIPEDFYEYLSPSGIYVTKKYPEDGSNIYIVTASLYGTLPDESEYTRKINENLTAQAGVNVSVKMEEFEKTTVDGFDAIKAVYSYSYDGIKFKRTEYTVNTNITTTIAYTQVNNADWEDEFEASAFSMRVE
ncbi:MAG: hypothetical protein K2K54_12800 [Lachnospiraceae bacterium]|nr:hypothetical protein [Lachnospiraceae bacterium]